MRSILARALGVPAPAFIPRSGITTRELAVFQKLLREKSGIILTENKRSMVEARVKRRLDALGLASFSEYLDLLERDQTGDELVLLIDAISTNVTRFFREADHFDFLKDVVQEWADEGKQRLRFWSAACSTGEEPYSLAMALQEQVTTHNLDLKILATDISTRVLAHAQAGFFGEKELETVPPKLRSRYFTRNPVGGINEFEISEELKKMVMFRRQNFTEFPYPIKGVFDVIICRNAMIYFDKSLRAKMVDEFARLLKPGGYLVVGHAETLIGIENEYRTVRPSIFQRNSIGENR